MRILTILALILIPFSGIIKLPFLESVWFSQYLAFLIFIGLFACINVWKFNKYISLFMILALLSTAFHSQFLPRAVMCLTTLYSAIFISISISKLSDKDKEKIIKGIIVLIILQGIWLVVQLLNISPEWTIKGFKFAPFFKAKDGLRNTYPVGFCGSANQLGTFFAMTLPYTVYFPFILPISLFGLFIAKSTFALFSAISSFLFFAYFRSKKLFRISLIVCICLFLLFITVIDKFQSADKIRFYVWEYAIDTTVKGELNVGNVIIKSIPLLGFGFGSFMRYFPYIPQGQVNSKFNYSNEKFSHAHNDFVEVFFELGILSWIIIAGFFIDLFMRARKVLIINKKARIYASAFVACIISAMGNFIFQIALSGLLIILSYGLLEGEINKGVCNG